MVATACHASPDGAAPDASGTPDARGEPPPDAWVDLAGPLFAPDHVVEVAIAMAPDDWIALGDQTRTIPALFSTCGTGPYPDPFTYFHAAVTIDGTAFGDVGVRKKGFLGSMDSHKPSLKLKLDEYVDGQSIHGEKGLTLNNSKQDASLIRTCMSYHVFALAGLPAPRCNFAHVVVNGDDLGVYVDVEAVNKTFLRGHFADPEGNLYEGTLSDFRAGWEASFEAKTNESTADGSDLAALTTALEAPDDQLLARLAPVIDVDAFIRFWAAEILVAHWDGFTSDTNNFFVYHDPTSGKLTFIPWGPDMSFVAGGSPFNLFSPISVQATAMLARRLYLLPETRDRYVAAMHDLLATVWNEPALFAEVDRMAALIQPVAGRDLTADVQTVTDFIVNRRNAITTEQSPNPPDWTTPIKPHPLCLVPAGSVAGSFSTTWGTDGSWTPFAVGDGTITGTIDGAPLAFVDVGATSGLGLLGAPQPAQITIIGKLADGTLETIGLSVADPERWFRPGTDQALDWTHVTGLVTRGAPLAIPTLVGAVTDGTLHLDGATMTTGAPITGTFSGQVLAIEP